MRWLFPYLWFQQKQPDMNKLVLKIGLGIILILATIQGNIYLFNHVDPWLGYGVCLLGIVLLISLIVNIIKTNFK